MQGNQAGYSTLLADASGVVTAVDLEPGMVAAAGTPVLRLAHNGPRDVVFAVPEDKVGMIKALAGQPGRFKVRLWGATGEPLAATTREISAAADPHVPRQGRHRQRRGERHSPRADRRRAGRVAADAGGDQAAAFGLA